MADRWQLTGQVLVACNCDWGCPCNFNASPTTGKCEGGWTWHVDAGSFGDVILDDLNFSVYVNWPGPIHDGNGEAVILIDERATPQQRAAIMRRSRRNQACEKRMPPPSGPRRFASGTKTSLKR